MIGVLGASGEVGRAAVRALRGAGAGPLRVGARRLDELRSSVAPETRPDESVELMRVDARRPEELDRFCRGCRVVLNCSAPTYELAGLVAVAALSAGTDYVDVGGDDPVHEQLTAQGGVTESRTVILSAGVVPGLSSLLPRWMAGDLDTISRLSAYVGGMERCSPGVAADMLLSLETGGPQGGAYGEALAGWRHGRRVSRALRAREGAEAPFFNGPVALQPFLSAETERLGGTLGVEQIDWFNVHPGEQVRLVLNRLPTWSRSERDDCPDTAEAALIRAGELDLTGRDPYHLMVFVIEGWRSGTPAARTAVVRSPSSYVLTGFVGALAAQHVLSGTLRSGLHYACDVLDGARVMERAKAAAVASFAVFEGVGGVGATMPDQVEEGAL